MSNRDSSFDLVLAVIFAIAFFFITVFGLAHSAGLVGTSMFFVWVVILWGWYAAGFKKILVGWRAQALLFGGRINYFMREGLHWLPFPLGIKMADCREVVVELDHLDVFTRKEDNVKVGIDGSLFRRINNLDLFFSVDESSLKRGLDDIWDQTIRVLVRDKTLEEVLGWQVELKTVALERINEHANVNWGIDILRLKIAGIVPPKEVQEDMELQEREKFRRDGLRVENDFFLELVKKLTLPPPLGAGLSLAQATEQAQLTIGKATKSIDNKSITLDTATAEAIAAVVGRRG